MQKYRAKEAKLVVVFNVKAVYNNFKSKVKRLESKFYC